MTAPTNTRAIEALHKAAPLLCRASVEIAAAKLYAAGSGDESGDEITPAMRDELLAKLKAGLHVAIDADILAYEQRTGVANRNFVRFRDGNLIALGGTGKGRPFLRDHEQRDSLAVAGKVLTSRTTKLDEGRLYELRQRVRVTAPWAVELALRDLLFAVSIGWEPTGPVECSACAAPIYTKCYHWPGDKVTETPQSDGSKKYLRDRSGALTVEWIYTSAELIETSMCPIGGVKLAGFEGVRAALAATFPDDEHGDGLVRGDDLAANSTRDDVVPQPVLTPEPHQMSTPTIVVLTESQAAYYGKLSASDQAGYLAKSSADRDADVARALAADPVLHTAKSGLEIRRSHGEVALALAKQSDAQSDALDAQRKQLDLATETATVLTLRTRATLEIGHLAGTDSVKVAVLRALDGIADEPTRSAAILMLKGADAAFAELGTAKGADPASDPKPDSPEGKAEALAAQLAKDEKVTLEIARAMVWDTPEGERLYAEIEQRKNAARTREYRAQ